MDRSCSHAAAKTGWLMAFQVVPAVASTRKVKTSSATSVPTLVRSTYLVGSSPCNWRHLLEVESDGSTRKRKAPACRHPMDRGATRRHRGLLFGKCHGLRRRSKEPRMRKKKGRMGTAHSNPQLRRLRYFLTILRWCLRSAEDAQKQ